MRRAIAMEQVRAYIDAELARDIREKRERERAERTVMTEEEIERRLWALNRALGGSTPIPDLEATHRHAELAACHFAAFRQLQA